TLADGQNYPFSCSFDARTGDLAVSNALSLSSGQPGIAIYRHEQGPPTLYRDPKIIENYFIGYGPRSQIFFDGVDSSGRFELARLYRKRFSPIVVKGTTIPSPEGVQYAQGTLTISGPDGFKNALIYRLTKSGTITGVTHLLGGGNCFSYEIWKSYVLCASTNNNVPVFKYPAGGAPLATIGPVAGPFQPVISEAPKR
ncbi:MAG: hypothetical protein JO263_06925, partial [Candidatus Eremiobacteraeota bacterium]|nr:hypothetical protein [Candidatus Eremiobacteraeota bacterium]